MLHGLKMQLRWRFMFGTWSRVALEFFVDWLVIWLRLKLTDLLIELESIQKTFNLYESINNLTFLPYTPYMLLMLMMCTIGQQVIKALWVEMWAFETVLMTSSTSWMLLMHCCVQCSAFAMTHYSVFWVKDLENHSVIIHSNALIVSASSKTKIIRNAYI